MYIPVASRVPPRSARFFLSAQHRSMAENRDLTGNPGLPTRRGFNIFNGGLVGRRCMRTFSRRFPVATRA